MCFLVAIPLCLGIALASGAPLFSGIIAGIVGGIVVTLFSDSALGVSGPAAGLVAIVVAAITELGFDAFLVAVVIAGVIQIVLGFLRMGIIGYYFPSSVITGMLAAIGLIIILKQIPHAVGYDKDFEGDLSFSQADGHNTFSELGYAFNAVVSRCDFNLPVLHDDPDYLGATGREEAEVHSGHPGTARRRAGGNRTECAVPAVSGIDAPDRSYR